MTDELRWRRAQTKEAAIAAAKDRSKGELWLQQRREDALRRREGAGATTADGPAAMMRVAQPEGAGAAIEGGAGGGGVRSGGSRSGAGPPSSEAPAGRPPAAAASRSGRTRKKMLLQ